MRITRLGYFSIVLIVLIVLIIACICVLQCGGEEQGSAAAISNNVGVTTPDLIAVTPAPTLPVSQAPIQSATKAPTYAATGARLPTEEEQQGAVEGVIRTSNVVLRKGAGKSYDVIKKYDVGERVLVFALEDGYYLVRVIDDTRYGFMAAEFITKFGLLPHETSATPVPTAPEGSILGLVNVDEVSLRGVPSTHNNEPISACRRGETVWVWFKTDEFYYVQIAATGQKGYLFAEYIMTQADVPAGTPVPKQ